MGNGFGLFDAGLNTSKSARTLCGFPTLANHLQSVDGAPYWDNAMKESYSAVRPSCEGRLTLDDSMHGTFVCPHCSNTLMIGGPDIHALYCPRCGCGRVVSGGTTNTACETHALPGENGSFGDSFS
jgi:hypothetical protein